MQSKVNKFSFKLKDDDSSTNPSDILDEIILTNEIKLKEPQNNSRVDNLFTLKKTDKSKKLSTKKYKNENYFGIKNHIDLFKIGKHYSKLQEDGQKSFAFCGNSKTSSSQHSILGIAAYFNYHHNFKATVIIGQFNKSTLSHFLNSTHIEMDSIENSPEEFFETHICDGIEIIELDKLKKTAKKIDKDIFDNFLKKILKKSDIVLWDLPITLAIEQEREYYLPILNIIDSLTIVVDTGFTTKNDINEINKFAGKYQCHVEGFLLYNKDKKI